MNTPERNPNIERIEDVLERDIFDAKPNHPFEISLAPRRGNIHLTATWHMDVHGPVITTHERFSSDLPDFPGTDNLVDNDIALPLGHMVFDALAVDQDTSHRFEDGKPVSSARTTSYLPRTWIEHVPEWVCDYVWFAFEGIPLLPIPNTVTQALIDSSMDIDPRFVVEPVTILNWNVGPHLVQFREHSHTRLSDPHYSGTVSRRDRGSMNKAEIETTLGILSNAWQFTAAAPVRLRAVIAYDFVWDKPKAIRAVGGARYAPQPRDNWFTSYDRDAAPKVELVANLISNSRANTYLDQAIHCFVGAETLNEHGLIDIAFTTAVNGLEALCTWKKVRDNRSRRKPSLAKNLETLLGEVGLWTDDVKGTRRRFAEIGEMRNDLAHARVPKFDAYDYLKMHQAFSECQWPTETVILISATGETSRFSRQVFSADGKPTLKGLIRKSEAEIIDIDT